ncbi:family 78 glycoside hydrolase catalytic domain [uncultured Imperialibacter sp.]|uniref:family 78 glycoside hydrolase catalytic domain n=1 Tax=uncultured Imperialibacter sp. TaxID=1672639 RepID=UPI0030D930F4|tara:strand:- start:2110 stop:5769 length:3660 start_codon:yes stop_codon:yes gene_type:complete
MKNRYIKGVLFSLLLLTTHALLSQGSFQVVNLKTEYASTPLGIDVEKPRFSWQMQSSDNSRGLKQTAYQIVVASEKGNEVWNSGKIESDKALGVTYGGAILQPTIKYNWTVTLWDNQKTSASASSWFETGLMNADPNLSAWSGATWIGGSDDDLVFYSHYLSVFKLSYQLQLDKASASTKAGFIFGANDSRLMDKDMNILGVHSGENESYIKFELDISKVDGTPAGLASFNIYRVGYSPEDKAGVPFKIYQLPLSLVNNANKYAAHTLYADCNFGVFEIFIDGDDTDHLITKSDDPNPSPFAPRGLNLNPVGVGNNFISFPMVADIGFSADKGQKASFSSVEIKNFRFPSNALFKENLASISSYKGVFSDFINGTKTGFSIANAAYVVDGVTVIADPSQNATPMLRTKFSAENKPIAKARLYVTARGIYEMYINGQRISNDYFNPGLTQYNKTHMYQTYDVTDKMMAGKANAVGAWLAEGWWSGNITYSGESWNYFGDRQSLLAKLVVTYADGTEQVITTKPNTWKLFTDGPIRVGSFFQGEVYDSSKDAAVKNWATPDYNDANWKPAVKVPLESTAYIGTFPGRGGPTTFDYDDLQLVGQMGANPSIVKTLTAKSVEEVRPGVFVYDMGQNMVGFPNISLNGTAGNKITLRYAEVKYPSLDEYGNNVGMIMLENIRAALTQDIWILKGGDETVQPRFTFHGYRFLEITGIEKALPLESVKGMVVSSIQELASSYQTSNDLVNKLWENITWSMRGNFLSIPTDTPARNERMGWSGDINVFSGASTYLANNDLFLRRHLLAMRDIQREDGRFTDVAPVGGGFGGTLWGSAGIIVAWESYRQYGDVELLREHYDAMKKYVAFLQSKTDPKTGIINEGPLGDWLSPENNKNDNTLFWTAYQIYDLEIVAKTANILGHADEAKTFLAQREERKAFFNSKYVDKVTHKTVKSGFRAPRFGPPGQTPDEDTSDEGQPMDTQASYAIPLALGAFNAENVPYAIQYLAATIERQNTDDGGATRPAYSLMTGFIGTASLTEALSENGRSDLAYKLLQQTSYPSWLYSVVNGATTIWERLNSYTVENGFGGNNSMNSFNHYSFGAVGAWMYNYSLGIQRDPDSPAFKHFILQPTPDPTGQMTWAKGYYDSMYGRIESSWKVEGNKLSYTTTVPPNTSATLYLPTNSSKDITEGGKSINKNTKGVTFVKMENGKAVFELGSGSYEFVIAK